MDFHGVYQSYKARLHHVEDILHHSAKAHHPVLSQAGHELIDAGGKRLRPLFAIICGTVGDPDEDPSENVGKVAAALELTHMATLVHDDVIDHADKRRGRPTVRSAHGNLAAMYTGDFLFARAIQLLAEVNNARVQQQMAQGIVRMCQGEVEQLRDLFEWEQSIRTYLRRIERKTALLIALSCSLGARVGQASETDISLLKLFGHYTGMAFQIIDDVLDFTGSENVVGKPVGGDMRQGNFTLPVLLAMKDDKRRVDLKTLVNENMTDADVHSALDIILTSGALEESRALADQYLTKAQSVLERVSAHRVQGELAILTHFVAERAF